MLQHNFSINFLTVTSPSFLKPSVSSLRWDRFRTRIKLQTFIEIFGKFINNKHSVLWNSCRQSDIMKEGNTNLKKNHFNNIKMNSAVQKKNWTLNEEKYNDK